MKVSLRHTHTESIHFIRHSLFIASWGIEDTIQELGFPFHYIIWEFILPMSHSPSF